MPAGLFTNGPAIRGLYSLQEADKKSGRGGPPAPALPDSGGEEPTYGLFNRSSPQPAGRNWPPNFPSNTAFVAGD